MRFPRIAAVALLTLALTGSALASETIDNLKVGNMTLRFNKQEGFKVDYKGATVITESALHIAKPGWLKIYYSYEENGAQGIETRDIPGGKEVLVRHKTEYFDGDDRITIFPNKVTFDLRYKLTADVPEPGIEYTIGYFSAPLINGCAYKAETAKGQESGIVPLKPLSTDSEVNLTKSPFKKITFDSRVGKLTIETNGNPDNLNMIDWRGLRTPWAGRNPIFFLAPPRTRLVTGEEKHSIVTFSFDPISSQGAISRPAASPTIKSVSDVRKTMPKPIVVIPQPQEMKMTAGDFVLGPTTQIVVGDKAKEEDLRGAKSFAEEISAYYGMQVPVVHEREAVGDSLILIGEAGENSRLEKAASAEKIVAPEKDEGYALKIAPKQVILLGHDRKGTYYGCQTLKQLVKASVESLSLQGCVINDYPSLAYRGLYIYTGIDALPFHQKMVDRILSRFKMNNLIICADQIHWKSAPETAPNDGMRQEDLRKDIAYANDHFIEVNPEVSALCHANWMFCTGNHSDLAEDPEHKFAYCPSKKESYDFIYKILDEAVDVFNHPKYVHIGHDELNSPASEFPHDDACRKRGLANLFLDDTMKLYNHLKEKNVGVMLWGDQMLSKGESPDACNMPDPKDAEYLRKSLPKDVIVTDWHYDMSKPSEFHSLKLFHDEGLRTIVSTWYTPANVQNFSQAAKDNHSMGLLQTTWAGWNSNERDIYGEFKDQFTAIVLGAEYAWNSGKMHLDQLPYDYEDVFFREWKRGPVVRESSKGFAVDLKPLYNAPLANKPGSQIWVGLGPNTDLSAAPTGNVRLQDDFFSLSADVNKNSAIRFASALDGAKSYPAVVEIKIGRPAKSLLFLQTCAWSDTPGRVVGSYKINYADGKSEKIEMIYRKNATAWTDAGPCPDAALAWKTDSPDGQRLCLRELEWKNPRPEESIRSIMVSSTVTDGAPVLLGLSGISPE